MLLQSRPQVRFLLAVRTFWLPASEHNCRFLWKRTPGSKNALKIWRRKGTSCAANLTDSFSPPKVKRAQWEKVVLNCTCAIAYCNVKIPFYKVSFLLFYVRNWSRCSAATYQSEAAHQSEAPHPENTHSSVTHDDTLWKNPCTHPKTQQKKQLISFYYFFISLSFIKTT